MDQFPEEASEGLQEPETQPQEVVVEPDSGLGRVSEAQTEEETEEDDYTGFYTVVENGAMTPDKVASPQEAVAEDSSDDEFGQKDMIGTGVIGAMPVVTAGPNMAEDADSDEDVCLSDTEVMLLGGGAVSDWGYEQRIRVLQYRDKAKRFIKEEYEGDRIKERERISVEAFSSMGVFRSTKNANEEY